jgi:hypothetical protein
MFPVLSASFDTQSKGGGCAGCCVNMLLQLFSSVDIQSPSHSKMLLTSHTLVMTVSACSLQSAVDTPVIPWTKGKKVKLILLKRTFILGDMMALRFITQVFILLSAQHNYIH